MMQKSLIVLACAAFALTACDRRKDDQFAFNGIIFKSSSDRVSKEERDHFLVQVRGANQDLEAAREAGRYEATRYCIKEYGTSRMDWVIGPDSENTIPVDDVLQLEGYCRT